MQKLYGVILCGNASPRLGLTDVCYNPSPWPRGCVLQFLAIASRMCATIPRHGLADVCYNPSPWPRRCVLQSLAMASRMCATIPRHGLADVCYNPSPWPCGCVLQSLAIASRMCATNQDLVNGVPSWKWSKGPTASPRKTMSDMIATTGQSSSPIAPRNMATSRPHWSVFERLRKIPTLDRGCQNRQLHRPMPNAPPDQRPWTQVLLSLLLCMWGF